MSIIEQAADRLWQARQTGTPCAPVRDLLGESDVAAAYAVQEINTRRQLEKSRIVGAKIGLTSRVVQQQLGVHQPDFGLLFADMDVLNAGIVPFAELSQPKVEAEIAFILGKDLPHADCTSAEVIAAVDHVVPALEIVGSRVAGWDIRITDTIADNASSSHFVLGPVAKPLAAVDLLDCAMELELNGEKKSSGKGRACLGSPLSALVWLARTMAASGRPLQAGHVVLSGALGPMVAVTPGDTCTARIEGLGEVSVEFGGLAA
jgi:2-keto-4-pentenoate hydratase